MEKDSLKDNHNAVLMINTGRFLRVNLHHGCHFYSDFYMPEVAQVYIFLENDTGEVVNKILSVVKTGHTLSYELLCCLF